MGDAQLSLFLLAALVIAVIPGPGIFYVASRTLSGGRQAGIASTFGTALGGLVHVVAVYLVWLGIKTFREAGNRSPEPIGPTGAAHAFREGVLVEALNPKTAAFFLAFIPQFLDPAAGYPALQFIAFGLTSVALNTCADIVVVMLAARARVTLVSRPRFIQRLRQGSGLFIAGLGISLALARRPATA